MYTYVLYTRNSSCHEANIFDVAVAASGTIVTGGRDHTVRVWDARSSAPRATLEDADAVTSVAAAADGRHVASGNDAGVVKVWALAAGKAALTLKGHKDRVNSVDFCADGEHVASASDDGGAKIWSAGTGVCTKTLAVGGGFLQSYL